MYKRKRLVSLLLVSALASGCASAGKTEETTQPPQTTQEEAETTGTAEETSGAEEETKASAAAAISYTAGTYEGTAKGHNGSVTVEVEFSDSSIMSVTVTDQEETPQIAAGALEQIPARIVEEQSLMVDAVTGATITSSAILEAVGDCAAQAGGDVELLVAKAEEQPEKNPAEDWTIGEYTPDLVGGFLKLVFGDRKAQTPPPKKKKV